MLFDGHGLFIPITEMKQISNEGNFSNTITNGIFTTICAIEGVHVTSPLLRSAILEYTRGVLGPLHCECSVLFTVA